MSWGARGDSGQYRWYRGAMTVKMMTARKKQYGSGVMGV